MSRFSPIDLSAYPVADILETLDHATYLARDKADFLTRWAALRVARPDLPVFDTTSLDSEPTGLVLANHAYREMIWRGHINDRVRQLSLAGALKAGLDHIGATYYRAPRRIITPADPIAGTAALLEDDETYRQRLALAPESWSIAGPEGAYLFWALSASGEVLDCAVYSEDEGACLAPQVRVVVLARTGDGTASAALQATVLAALRRAELRPMGDLVTVESATRVAFDVDITLRHRAGASVDLLKTAAEQRIRSYCEGRLRWLGDGVSGPVWLIGRHIRQDTIAAAGLVEGVEEVVVNTPSADVNVPADDYAAGLPIAANASAALAPELTAHLFAAPKLGTITLHTEVMTGGWS